MKITKNMKEYVEEQMNAKRNEINKAYRADYDARKRSCEAAIKEELQSLYSRIEDILVSYNMDIHTYNYDGTRKKETAAESIIRFYDCDVRNKIEIDEIRDHENKMYSKQKEMLKRFYLECDLGVNKEEFLALVAAMNFDD